MDKLEGMRAFVRVVEAGSFTKAAETLHVSKTTVTQLVQQLEADLRVKLLNRTTRKVNLTTAGAAYYERVIPLLAELDDIENNIFSEATAPRGLLRVDVPSPFANIILVPALPEFHARFPEIQLDIGASDRKVDLIGENVDCVVRGGEIEDGSLVVRRVANLQLGVYLRQIDPLAFEEVVMSALDDAGLLGLRNRSYTGDGGIDGVVWNPRSGWLAVQVKRYRAHICHGHLREFDDAILRAKFDGGVFVHTGRSGAGAYAFLRDSGIILLSGERLITLVLRRELVHWRL